MFAKKLVQVWLQYYVAQRLWDSHVTADLRDVPFVFDRKHFKDEVDASLSGLHVLFKQWFHRTYAENHLCAICAETRSVGVDNKVGAAPSMCKG